MKFLIPIFAFLGIASAASVGGKNKIDPNSQALKDVLPVAEHQISNQINSMYAQKIIRVIEAESQVVSGILFHIKFELGQTECLKTDIESGKTEMKLCEAKGALQLCEARILSQPWLKNTQVTKVECHQEQQPQEAVGPVGGFHPIDPTSDEMNTILGFMGRLNKEITKTIGGEKYFMCTKVLEAQSQVVAGINYQIKFQMTETRCDVKGELFAECKGHLNPDSTKTCTATVWSKPWMDFLSMTKISCQ